MLFLFFLQVNTNGMISFNGPIDYYKFDSIDNQFDEYPVVAPLACDADTSRNHGRVYYSATTDKTTLQRATSDVSNRTDFTATFVFITTWHDVTYKISTVDGNPVSKLYINRYQPLSVSNMHVWPRL